MENINIVGAATIKDIAKRTGIGISTISKYINGGNVREATRIAIDKAIQELNFTVNEFARGLKTNKSKTVGVMIPEFSNVFITSIITVIEDYLRKSGYGIIVCDCRTDEIIEAEAIEFLVKKRVDGLIHMPVTRDGMALKPIINKNIPVILIDRMINQLNTRVDAVVINNIEAARMATDYLLQHGHTNIGIIIGPKNIFTSQQRLSGYSQAFSQHCITPNMNFVKFSDYSVQGGYESVKFLLSQNITALFVTNYEMTLGAMLAISELGVKIPQELSLIGFDNLHLAKIIQPNLTIITQPLEEIGKEAANLMLYRLSTDKDKSDESTEKKIVTLSAKLQIGNSVKNITPVGD